MRQVSKKRSDGRPNPAQMAGRLSYDDKQAGATLVTCAGCQRAFYMTEPCERCVDCAGRGRVTGEPTVHVNEDILAHPRRPGARVPHR